MNKTGWFPGTCDPTRDGEYEVKRKDVRAGYPIHTFLHFSTEKGWTHTKHSSCGKFVGDFAHMGRLNRWRGLLKEPT